MKSAEADYINESLIKSKKRVADHGEVFTPSWLIEAMLDLTEESDRIESRFLEPACGTGNFLIRILQRKLAIVELKSRKTGYDRSRFALIAIMSLYGIELLEDNIIECRNHLLNIFTSYLNINKSNDISRAAYSVLTMNLVHGDALKMRTANNRPIIFSEWNYLGKGNFRRQDFRFDQLIQKSKNNHEKILPMKVYESLTITEIAYSSKNNANRKVL